MTNKFPKPDEHGFFKWDDGGVRVFDGDVYIVRNNDGEEREVCAAVDECAELMVNDEESIDDIFPSFDVIGIKPEGLDDRIIIGLKVTGKSLADDLAKLEQAFPSPTRDTTGESK